jgi:hypothetical protein
MLPLTVRRSGGWTPILAEDRMGVERYFEAGEGAKAV